MEKLYNKLNKSNKSLKSERANIIVKDIQNKYKREIEDLQVELENLKIDQDNNFDIHSDQTTQIISPKNIDTLKLIKTDIDIIYNIRNLELKIELLEKRYNELFGENDG